MYSAVVSASSTSPTNSEANTASSKTDQYPPMPKLKSSPILKDPIEDNLPRSPTESGGGGGGGAYNSLV